MIIKWHGHSCFQFFDSLSLVIDPHDGRSIGLKTPRAKADIVLVTHNHFDHNATRVISGEFKIIDAPGDYKIGSIRVQGYPAYHDKEKGARRGKITMFKVTMDGFTMLHLGDLGHTLTDSQIKDIGKVDILMTPVGGTYTIDAKEAYKNALHINPKVVIPMHYSLPGLSLSLAPVDNFLRLFPEEKIYHVGNSIDLQRRELPQEMQVWVFSI